MGLNLGFFGFLANTHAKLKANQLLSGSSCSILHVFVCLQAQTTVHAGHIRTFHGYFDYGKNQKTPNLSPYRDQDGAGLGISGLYLWHIVTGNSKINVCYS